MSIRRMMLFTLGAKIKNLIDAFKTRVLADFGIFEAESCLNTQLTELDNDNLLDNASLIVTPNAYKETRLYSVVPNNTTGDMVVTRATTATRVNSDGFIEEVPYNLFSQSQNFENVFWLKQRTTIGQNVILAPDGTLTADNVIADSGVTYSYIGPSGVNVVSNSFLTFLGTRTASAYLKYNGLNRIRFVYASTGQLGINIYIEIDLQTGTITNTRLNNGGIDYATNPFIEDAGNGWYRVGFNLIAPASVTNNRIAVALGDTTKTIANGVDGVYVWGAQLVTGTQAKDYFPTTNRQNVPRIDYSSGSCPSILVEPQRTNLVIESERINLWTGGLNTTVTPNVSIGPNGTQSANNINITNIDGYWRRLGLNLASSTTYAASVFVKKSATTNNKTFSFYYNNNVSSPNNGVYSAVVNLTNLTITTTPTGTITTGRPTIISSLLSDYGNGWYRVIVIFTTGSSAGSSNSEIGFQANGEVVDFDAWGAQLEAGTNATSYIPTVASTVTRNADVITNTNASTLIGQTEGSVYAEVNINDLSTSTNIFQLSFDGSNRFGIQDTGTSTRVLVLSNQFTGTTFTFTRLSVGLNKVCLVYTNGLWKVFRNGVLSAQQANDIYTSPLTTINVGAGGSPLIPSGFLNGGINELVFYKTALTDAQAIQLTTL
jgi:hypothetical protein